jgi:hypothetical protein
VAEEQYHVRRWELIGRTMSDKFCYFISLLFAEINEKMLESKDSFPWVQARKKRNKVPSKLLFCFPATRTAESFFNAPHSPDAVF